MNEEVSLALKLAPIVGEEQDIPCARFFLKFELPDLRYKTLVTPDLDS